MRVIINRNLCGHPPFACEQCFGEFLRTGAYADRSCMLDVIDDGKPEVTAVITSGSFTRELVITDDIREEVIYDGYMKFADFPLEAFEIQPPHGQDIRRIEREYEQAKHKSS
ncbi:MAG: hypothetical protein HY741_22890 [Chloroflexi bacterium]|nr:hypothetical protein [Chloroflexota bacterium]